jgi:hypothetical protein
MAADLLPHTLLELHGPLWLLVWYHPDIEAVLAWSRRRHRHQQRARRSDRQRPTRNETSLQ